MEIRRTSSLGQSKSVLTLTDVRRKAHTLFRTTQARSSVVEHYIDTVGVGSSILPAPTVPLVEMPAAAAVLKGLGLRGRGHRGSAVVNRRNSVTVVVQ